VGRRLASLVIDRLAVELVPLRALALSLLTLAVAITAAWVSPRALLDQEVLASGLALLPALLLAHYRRWSIVSGLLGGGLVALTVVQLSPSLFGLSLQGALPTMFVVAPYIAIVLSAGWFGEVRRYQAQLEATQLQLIQSEKLDSIGRMAAGIAHEVKNPLMMILTGTKILSKRLGNADESTRQLLQDMADAVGRADRIIGGLLSYSRAGGLDLAPADLNATIETSLLFVKHELDKVQIAVVKNLDASIPTLHLDVFKMQQVFINLLMNAIHAIGQNGEITITSSLQTLDAGTHVGYDRTDRYAPGERVAIVKIEDSGPGIPAEHLPKLFDPFFTTKPVGRGTGLGLPVCRQIVEMHGGTIDIGNREGGGARATTIVRLEHPENNDEKTTDSAGG
jgi:signal transduction histidine kinase